MSAPTFSRVGLSRLYGQLSSYVDRGAIPGLVSLVARGGEVQVDAIGSLASDGVPMQRDTIFRISSMTKPITAVAAMILVEECRLRLDDPVDELLPELANRRVLARLDGPLDETVPAKRPITVRDLLTFRSGIGLVMRQVDEVPILRALRDAGLEQGPPNPARLPDADAFMKAIGSLPLMYQPGERWMYHWSATILGVLVARAAGEPLESFFRERIFEPLGMKDTAFSVPEAKQARLATQYQPAQGGLAVYDLPGGQWSAPPPHASGSDGLVSTADDLLAFSEMLLGKGKRQGVRVLSRPSVEVMTTDHLTAEQHALGGMSPGDFQDLGWGLGLAVVTRRANVAMSVGTFGWDGGLGTSWYADPREDLTGILLTQVGWTSPAGPRVRHDFWTSAYQAIED
ncbi:MAG: serine hydrolase [Labilithrix sp.]|nr:serine hydrolase [Labilithrix sp.]